jgi:GAF domain-containing protein
MSRAAAGAAVVPRALLTTVVQAAVGTTGALDGWLLALDDDSLVVVAVGGTDRPLGERFPRSVGSAGFAAASAQPVARRRAANDSSEAGSALARFHPDAPNVLAVPCTGEDGVAGVLELVAKQGAAAFGIDDIELATVIATIAAAALEELAPSGADGPSAGGTDPQQLLGPLATLAGADPDAFRGLAAVVAALVGSATRPKG